jgi:hypothetical protein
MDIVAGTLVRSLEHSHGDINLVLQFFEEGVDWHQPTKYIRKVHGESIEQSEVDLLNAIPGTVLEDEHWGVRLYVVQCVFVGTMHDSKYFRVHGGPVSGFALNFKGNGQAEASEAKTRMERQRKTEMDLAAVEWIHNKQKLRRAKKQKA